MKSQWMALAASILLSTAAAAQSPTASSTPGAVPRANVSTPEFVKKVAISDMFEIESSRLALTKQPDADTKPFAERMVQDHQETTAELKQLVQAGKVKEQLPTELDAEHKRKLDELGRLSGRDFDTAYDRAQQEAHREAVALFESYAQTGDNPDLKQWAAKTLSHLKAHLTMADQLQ
jgi:putative membrane protein